MTTCQWRWDHCDYLYDEHTCGDACNMFKLQGYMTEEGMLYSPGILTPERESQMTPVYVKVMP